MFQFKHLFNMFSFKFLLLLSLVHYGSSVKWLSYSTSVVAMNKLLNIESRLLKTVDKALLKSETEIQIVRSYINSVNEEHKKSKKDPETYLSNPLNSFTLLRRTYEDWPKILKYLGKPMKKDIENELEDNKSYLPISNDMTEAVLGINRIKITYKLSAMDIAKGQLNGVKYDGRLSCVDLYAIGFELFELEYFADAAVWLNASLHTDYQGPTPKEIFNCDQKTIKTLYLGSLFREETFEEEFKSENFNTICRGEGLKLTNDLFCRYNTSIHYFHILAPSKMEVLSKDPYVVIFHDALTNSEISYLKREARFRLKRAQFSSLEQSLFRTTHTCPVNLEEATMKKIQAFTGLNPEGFEPMSILNYGLGGHYAAHHDYFYPNKEKDTEYSGDRIATMLFYLNEVEQGGATVFPEIGLYIKPEKGALLFWHNLKNNGDPNVNSVHGACPIIYGSKWAATIWVRERPQFRALPCFNP